MMQPPRVKTRVYEIPSGKWKWSVFRIAHNKVNYLDYGECDSKFEADEAAKNSLLFWVEFGWERETTLTNG
jgi:hypothetical protein